MKKYRYLFCFCAVAFLCVVSHEMGRVTAIEEYRVEYTKLASTLIRTGQMRPQKEITREEFHTALIDLK